MNLPWSSLGHQWLNTTLIGICHGLALTFLVWVMFKCLPRTNAATRHAIRFGALVLVAALPGLLWIVPLGLPVRPLPSESSALTSEREGAASRPNFPSTRSRPIAGHAAPITIPSPDSPSNLILSSEKEPLPTSRSQPLQLTKEPFPLYSLPKEPSPLDPAANLPGFRIDQSFRALTSWLPSLPHATGLVLFGIWFTLALLRLIFLARQYGILARFRKQGTPAPEPWQRRFDAIRESMKVVRPAQLRVVGELDGPIVIGFLRPTVLLPRSLMEGPDSPDLEKILRHEMAHIRRNDDWTNLVEQLIRALYFFHPAVWWLGRDLALDREIACDDYVLENQTQPSRYALLLMQFASRTKNRNWRAAPAAWNHRSQLKQRIDMLLDQTRNASPRLARVRTGAMLCALALAAGAVFQFSPRTAFGQEDKDQTPYPADDLLVPPTKDKSSQAHSTPSSPRSISTDTRPELGSAHVVVETPSSRAVISNADAPTVIGTTGQVPGVAEFHSTTQHPSSKITIAGSSSGLHISKLAGPDVNLDLPVLPEPPQPPPAPIPPVPPVQRLLNEAKKHPDAAWLAADSSGAAASFHHEHEEESLERRLARLEKLVDQYLNRSPKYSYGPESDADLLQYRSNRLADESDRAKRTPSSRKGFSDFDEIFEDQNMTRKDFDKTIQEFEKNLKNAEDQFHDAARQHELLTKQFRLNERQAALEEARRTEKQHILELRQHHRALQLELKALEKQIAELEAADDFKKESRSSPSPNLNEDSF